MSAGRELIDCRRCNETIRIEEGNCPHCGTTVRGTGSYVAAIVVGVVLFGASLLDFGSLFVFGLVGLLVAVVAGYLLYEKRQRIERASARP